MLIKIVVIFLVGEDDLVVKFEGFFELFGFEY